MPRRKISEYRAKIIVNTWLGLPYEGWSVIGGKTDGTLKGKTFVVKVDQAVKQRFKRGLIHLNVAKKDVGSKVKELEQKGYESLLIEPYVVHESGSERYISFRREREGVVVSYSQQGGVDIEAHPESIKSGVFEDFPLFQLANETGFSETQLLTLRKGFDDLYLSFLEINPYVVSEGGVRPLDVAIEVDSSAELLVEEWSESDVRIPAVKQTDEELYVKKLNKESPASFSLEVIEPNGSIFLLLSGGGASVVIADEIFTLGHGDKLANYGEYSGNPTEDETYRYTTQVLKLLLKSQAPQKVVLVGGAVANFTDIAATFSGIISALKDFQDDLLKQGVKFYVRRGGPRQAEGLSKIEAVLKNQGILGGVYNPSVSIPAAVQNLVEGLSS